jgi:hypothetical protein
MNADSPIVEEVRRRAADLSARFGDDLRSYADHLREIEAQHRERVVDQVTVVKSPATAGERRPRKTM